MRVNPGDARDAALAALFELGSLGVEEVGDELVTHFPDDVAAGDVIGAVQRAAPGSTIATSQVAAVDWSEEWKHGIRSVQHLPVSHQFFSPSGSFWLRGLFVLMIRVLSSEAHRRPWQSG